MLRYYLLFLVINSFSFCYGQNDTISINSNTPPLTIKSNENFVLKFLACHSCGYHWSLDNIDTTNVKLINVTCRNTVGRNNIKGGNVYEYWKFNVISVGTYILEFSYIGPGEETNGSVTRVELYVN